MQRRTIAAFLHASFKSLPLSPSVFLTSASKSNPGSSRMSLSMRVRMLRRW